MNGQAIQDPLRHAAEEHGDAEAVRFGEGRWSYAGLDAVADALARRLAGAGVGEGDRVAALLGTGPEAVAAIHGVPRAGAALALLPADWTPAELGDYLRRVRPRALLCGPGTAEKAAGLLRASGLLVRLGAGALASAAGSAGPEGEAGAETAAGADADDLPGIGVARLPAGDGEPVGVHPGRDHTILATSGTSGRPRGVRLTLANHLACQRAAVERLGARPDDRWLASLSPAHVGGVALVLRAALTGAALEIRPDFDAAGFLGQADAGRVTHASLVPTMLRRVLEVRGRQAAPSALRGVLVGGDAADPEMVSAALDAGWPLYPTYGLTEAASQVATATPEEARARPGAVGRPLEGVEVRIRDEEILVRGDTVSPGYLGVRRTPGSVRREGRVIPRQGETPSGDPDGERRETTDADGWLHTGDAGRLDDGVLTVTGRLSERIVSGGVNVDPAEVERVLRAHPEVRDACVVGLPDPEWGQRVAAGVERDPGSPEADPDDPLGGTELAVWFGDRLAPAKRPKMVRFLDRLPRTPNGKPDRDAVRDALASPPSR